MEVARTSWYAQHYLARAPNLEKKVQAARRQFEPDTSAQQLVTAEAQELSKLQQLSASAAAQARLTARQLATLTSEQLAARLEAASAPPPPAAPISASSSTTSVPATSRLRQQPGPPADPSSSYSRTGTGAAARVSSSNQQQGVEVLQLCRKQPPGGGGGVAATTPPGQTLQDRYHTQEEVEQQPQDAEEETDEADDSLAYPTPSGRESLAVLAPPCSEEPLVVEVHPRVLQHMRTRLSSITPRQPDTTGPTDEPSSTSYDATPSAAAGAAGGGGGAGAASAREGVYDRLFKSALRAVSPPRTIPPGPHPRAWSPPGARRAVSPGAAGNHRALGKAAGGHPVPGDTRPGVSQDQQQQQQQRVGATSRPGTSSGWKAVGTCSSIAGGKPLGRWSAQRAAREQQRQQQLEAAGQMLVDIDTTLADGRPVSGRRRAVEGGGSPPGTSGASRPATTQQQQQQQQQQGLDGLVVGNECVPSAAAVVPAQQQQAGEAGAAANAVSPLLQASMVLRWQKFNTAAAGEAASNTAWLTGILADLPKEEAAAAAAAGGACMQQGLGGSSDSMGQQLLGSVAEPGQAGNSGNGRCAGGSGGAAEQRPDVGHWPGALPSATHGHLSPDKLTFRALPGSKRQVYAQLADARACYHAIRTAGQALDQLQLLQEHERLA